MGSQESAPSVLTERYQPTTLVEAARLLAAIYGIAGLASRLSSEADETFAVTAADGRRLTLKIAGPAERPEVLAFQNGALLHLERSAPELPVPRLLLSLDGQACPAVTMPDGAKRLVRLMSWLDGRQLSDTETTIGQLSALGAALGRLDQALADYHPVVPELDLIWDLAQAPRVRPLLVHVAEDRRRALAAVAFDDFELVVSPVAAHLPQQVIHNDLNPYNLLVDKNDGDAITGIIDFGDLVAAPRINDLAIALSYHVGKPDSQALVRAGLAGFRQHVTVTEAEMACLGALVRARLAMTVTITDWRSSLKPDHAAYIKRNQPAAIAGLQRLARLEPLALRDFFFGDAP